MKYFLIVGIFFLTFGFFNSANAQEKNTDSNEIDKGTNDFSGKIFIGDNLLESGDIFLFQNIRNKYSLIKTNKLDNGHFDFNKVENGSYTIYVIPEMDYDFLFFPKYLPTYSGKAYRWENAREKTINENTNDFSFYLNSYSQPFFGNQSIIGKINYQTNFTGNKEFPVVLILLNEDYVPMDFRKVDEITGEFCFDHLPEGKYFLHPEVPGITSQDFEIELDREDDNEEINFNINDERIIIDETIISFETIPQGDYLKLYLNDFENSQVVCELISVSGKSVSKDIYHSDDVYINTSKLAAGIYILRVSTYNNQKVKTQKVYVNNYD